jgi:dihydrofolate reductase
MIADDELHDYFTQLMDAAGAMLFGRATYELMESAWPAVARDEKAPRAMQEWARYTTANSRAWRALARWMTPRDGRRRIRTWASS